MYKYEIEVEEDEFYGDEFATVVRVSPNGVRENVGYIGSEPEDNTYYRAYSWIVPALNDAFELGYKEGQKQE